MTDDASLSLVPGNDPQMTMDHRSSLRREAYDLKDACIFLSSRVQTVDGEAAEAIQRARYALFEAWTILCNPPEEEEDH